MATSRAAAPAADLETRLALYRTMVECRRFETRAQELFFEGLVRGTTHLGTGQEAVAAGFGGRHARRTTGRSPPIAATTTRWPAARRWAGLYAELFGRAGGLMGGKGGSMHITSVEHHMMGSYAIVGAHLPIALGAAWSAQYRGTEQVAVCFFGDGTTNIGAFHEALNLAAVWKAPVVFVCENNRYMEYTAIESVTAVARPAADRAAAYGLEPIVVDGNDADAVYAVATTALARARAGEGPSLIEAETYRHGGHSRADPGKYRPDDELAGVARQGPRPDLSGAPGSGRRRRGDAGCDRRRRDGQGRRGRGRRHATRPSPIPPCSRPRSGPTEARRGGTDLPRGAWPPGSRGRWSATRRSCCWARTSARPGACSS